MGTNVTVDSVHWGIDIGAPKGVPLCIRFLWFVASREPPRLAGGSPEAVPRENSGSEPSGFVAAWRKEDLKFPIGGSGALEPLTVSPPRVSRGRVSLTILVVALKRSLLCNLAAIRKPLL